MGFPLLARKALLIGLGLALAACAKEDGSRIIGKWRAERLEVMSLKLPVGPELVITRDALSTASDVSVPIAAITQDGDEVTLDTDALIGMTFHFVGPDRMYLELPVVGRVHYRRLNGPAVAAAPATTAAVAQPAPLPQPSAAPQPAQATTVEPAYARDYAQALVLVRQGDNDGALRSLHDAFKHGLRDASLLDTTPEFEILKSDVRYRALLSRYGGQ